MENKNYDLIILGGGPAGVAAGIYAARKSLATLLITKDFGGQSINSDQIENFIGFKQISGYDLSKNLEEHLRSQSGIEIIDGVMAVSVEKKDDLFSVKDSSGKEYVSKTVLTTLGSRYKRLEVPGEKEYEGKGVYYCSICDAPLMKGKKTVVVGGGNSGLEAVIDLLPYAEEIYVLEYADALKGDVIYQEKLSKEGKVKIILNVRVDEFVGDKFLKTVRYTDLKTNEKKELEVSGAFVQIGYQPNSELFKGLVEMNKNNQIIVDHKTFRTSRDGIWAAGDVTDGLYNQINTAMGDAIKAVLNVYDFLKKS